MSLKKLARPLVVTLVCSSVPALADSPAEINQTLHDFYSSDAKAAEIMDRPIVKRDASGQPVKVKAKFEGSVLANNRFVQEKDKARQNMCTEIKDKKTGQPVKVCVRDLHGGRAGIGELDQVQNLVDNGNSAIINIAELDKLKSAKLAETPWSDTYWPLYLGATAQRYNDAKFPAQENWKINFDFFSKSNRALPSQLNDLSPAEKYDLLVGDTSKTYTRTQWGEGQGFFDASKPDGGVETWMGICHGWSPAAYMLGRPTNKIKVTSVDGKEIEFFPSDIKALASSLWASGKARSKFIGGRCDVKDSDIQKTKAGRIENEECFDTNPGTWHTAIINQIGKNKRSMVMDATFDFEVWNQPVYGYKYTYFNPLTEKATSTLASAVIDYSSFKAKDKFKEFRDPKVVKIVGVSMDVQYIVETEPSDAAKDAPANDAITTATYMYDLELDADGNVIGGEWYTNAHPDFVWTPPVGERAVSLADSRLTGTWDAAAKPFPTAWKSLAPVASRQKVPMAKVVEALIKASRAAGGNR